MSLGDSLDRQKGKLIRQGEERFLVWYSVLKNFRFSGLDSKSFTYIASGLKCARVLAKMGSDLQDLGLSSIETPAKRPREKYYEHWLENVS
jgi:hypothetical protein